MSDEENIAIERARVIFGHVSRDNHDERDDGKACFSSAPFDFPDHQTMTAVSQASQADEKPVVVPPIEVVKKKKGTWLDSLNMNPKAHWPKKYRYTIEPPPGSTAILSVRERDHFEANGYIVVKNILAKSVLDKFVKGEPLGRYVTHPNVIKFVEQFTGPNLMAMKMIEWNDKTLDTMSPVDLVQDLFSLPFRPADRIVNTLTLLPHVDGSMKGDTSINFVTIPGSHRTSQMMTINDGEKVIHEVCPRLDLGLKKQINLVPGDTLFYHPLLAHTFVKEGSGSLNAISCIFAASECEYVSMTGNEGLEQLNRNLIHKDVKDWVEGAVLVKGNRINL